MARVLVTGSTTGPGEAAARQLLDDGHEVVLHARNAARAADIAELAERSAGVVVGDLSDLGEVRSVADQANTIGGIDAAIHNAGIYVDDRRLATPDGHPRPLAVNVLAPHLLTELVVGPRRLVYLSSGMHTAGDPALDDLGWTARRWDGVQAYCDSKLQVTALALATARRRPDVLVNVVDPGWVPTRMGGPSAPDDLEQGHTTQTWLAVADDGEATTSGGYWHHHERRPPSPTATDPAYQDALLDALDRLVASTR